MAIPDLIMHAEKVYGRYLNQICQHAVPYPFHENIKLQKLMNYFFHSENGAWIWIFSISKITSCVLHGPNKYPEHGERLAKHIN